jgi:hypothetical protein
VNPCCGVWIGQFIDVKSLGLGAHKMFEAASFEIICDPDWEDPDVGPVWKYCPVCGDELPEEDHLDSETLFPNSPKYINPTR